MYNSYNPYNGEGGADNTNRNYGNNPYRNNNGQYDWYFRRQKEKKSLRKLSLLAGGAFISYILVQNVAVVLLEPLGIMDVYRENTVVSTAMDAIFSVISILVPFMIFGHFMKKESGNPECYNFSKPHSFKDSAIAVVAGVGLCMLANVATSFFTVFMGLFGMKLTSPEITMPQGVTGVIANIIRTVIVAAFVEEICLRGAVMGNLRQYGDKFAILASSVVFGLMHGNLIQAPFALIAGCGLGYLSIKCGSLWVAVIIHAINNALSVIISYAVDIVPESVATVMQLVIIYGLAAVGVVCFVIFQKRNTGHTLRENSTMLSTGEMALSYITTPTMIISLLFIAYITSEYVEFSW